jgi:hypothetical protein
VSAIDRLLDSFRALVRAEFPALTFLGIYEYTVQSSSSATVDLVPTVTSIGLPVLTGVALRASVLGELVTGAAVGALALIEFVNGDPTRPICVSLSSPAQTATVDATGTLTLGPSAQSIELAGGLAPVARQGDAVTVYLGTGTTPISGTIDGATSFFGTITFAGPATGIIVAGNPKVTA